MSTEIRKPRILIVDDHDAIRALMAAFLGGAYPECRIDEASNACQAIKLVNSHPPDLVLMDIHLPNANGLELTAQIRALHPAVQVIVVTQNDSTAHKAGASAAGAIGYVVKDKLFAELIPLVARTLRTAAGSFA